MDHLFFDPATLYDEEGNLIPVHKLPESTRRANNGITGASALQVGSFEPWKQVLSGTRLVLHRLQSFLQARTAGTTSALGLGLSTEQWLEDVMSLVTDEARVANCS